MKKKILSILLAAVMVFSLLPATVWATEPDSTLPEGVNEYYRSVITLTNNVKLSQTYVVDSATTIELNGYTITGDGVPSFKVSAGYLELKNGTVTSTAIGKDSSVIELYDDVQLSVNGVKITTETAESTVAVPSGYSSITMCDGTVENKRTGGVAVNAASSKITVNSSNVTGGTGNTGNGKAFNNTDNNGGEYEYTYPEAHD